MLEGNNPYPPPDFDSTVGANYIWPPLVAYVLAPLTVLPLGVADVVMLAIGLAASPPRSGLSDSRLAGVRACRDVAADCGRDAGLASHRAHLPAARARLALARSTAPEPGILVGFAIAVKFFVWPSAVARVATPLRPALSRPASRARPSFFSCPTSRSRLSAVAAAARPSLRPGLVHGVRAGGAERGVGDGRAVTMWACGLPCSGHVAVWELHPCDRRGADDVADRVARLLRTRRVPLAIARPRLTWVWFLPLATWGLRGRGSTSATRGTSLGCSSCSRRVRRGVSRRAGAVRTAARASPPTTARLPT